MYRMYNMQPTKQEKRIQKMRDVSDFIYDSINRLKERIEILDYIDQASNSLIKYRPFLLSIIDVYSRDVVHILSNILDEDEKTSSLFTFCSFLGESKEKKSIIKKLKDIKTDTNGLIQLRSNHTGHFSTKYNSYDRKNFPINTPILIDSKYIEKRCRKIEELFWDIKEKLCIDGIFAIYHGSALDSFKELLEQSQKRF